MKTVIIEDNPSAQRLLSNLIEKYCTQLQVTGIASNVEEGLLLIDSTQPDLVFLDVEMPDGTGFELLEKLPQINFKVIFTTAHEKYALQAIKFSALDYLLKPIELAELLDAIKKAEEEVQKDLAEVKIKTLLKNLGIGQEHPKTIILKDKYGLQLTDVADIIRLEAMGSYTKFFIKDQAPILISKVLKEYGGLLPTAQFFRCHQSHIINMDFLLRYDKREGDVLLLKDGSKVPLAVRKRDALLEVINQR
ncbi:MAG: LytR/AlgR family response regulator transcription factor [Flammeovirgaceae bacterium]